MSKMGKIPNTAKLESNTVLCVKVRDIGNSPQKVGDLSSFDCSGGDGGGQVGSSNRGGSTGGIVDEEEGLW